MSDLEFEKSNRFVRHSLNSAAGATVVWPACFCLSSSSISSFLISTTDLDKSSTIFSSRERERERVRGDT